MGRKHTLMPETMWPFVADNIFLENTGIYIQISWKFINISIFESV